MKTNFQKFYSFFGFWTYTKVIEVGNECRQYKIIYVVMNGRKIELFSYRID